MLALVHPYVPRTRALAIAPAVNDNDIERRRDTFAYAPPPIEGGLVDRTFIARFCHPILGRLLVQLIAADRLR